MKLYSILLLTLTSFNSLLIADSKKWSPFQGKLKWEEAKEKCKSLGMKLPSIDELSAAYNADELKKWKEDGNTYWSSTEKNSDRAYYITLLDGNKFTFRKEGNLYVRCIQ